MLILIFGFLFFLVILLNVCIFEVIVRGKMNLGLSRKEAIKSIFNSK